MSWQSVAIITPSREWQYTPAILGNFFRIKHSSNSEFAKDFRAILAQAFDESSTGTFFDIKRLAFKAESEAFLFVQPGGLLNRKLAIKRLDYLSDDWQIEIEVLGGMSSSISLPIQITDVAGLTDELNAKTNLFVTSQLVGEINQLKNNLNTKADFSTLFQEFNNRFPVSFGNSGWQRLSGGLLVQWGSNTVSLDKNAGSALFPLAFNTAFSVVVCNADGTKESSVVAGWNNNGFSIAIEAKPGTRNVKLNWIAIGN
jgi:hypothetical protein